MSKAIHTPTNEFVQYYIKSFDKDNRISLTDKSISILLKKFPNNVELEEILLKVVSINTLYSTSILDTIKMAEWILKCNIDDRLKNGKADLVNNIAVGHGIRSNQSKDKLNPKDLIFYSFATKYCSWHNNNSFPIYDSFVEKILIEYQKRDKFSNFKAIELKDYCVFKNVICLSVSFPKPIPTILS